MAYKGYDLFFTAPGEMGEMACKVCGTTCTVHRDRYGPTSFVAAMGGLSCKHDLFECSHKELSWHEQALRLVIELEKTPSPRIAALLKKDLEKILHNQVNAPKK
jgi:hypothetical protein